MAKTTRLYRYTVGRLGDFAYGHIMHRQSGAV